MPSLKTPLFDAHQRLGARIVEFAGYDMPVQYQSVIAEAKAVRAGAGMFDVSHMARVRVRGQKVLEFVQWVSANDADRLADGVGQYSMLPNERGGVVDDIILYRLSATEFQLVLNASNHAKDMRWLAAHNQAGVEFDDVTEQTAMIAVQGPAATVKLAFLCSAPEALNAAPMFGVVSCKLAGTSCTAFRSGYTGEDGFEVVCTVLDAEKVWNALREAGVEPCGLGARDVLRVEAGLPLYGHELGDELSPIAAGLGWAIGKTKAFVGSDIIARARSQGAPQNLKGIAIGKKRVPECGAVVTVGGKAAGKVTSGVYSPLLERGIALAFLDAAVQLDTPCEVDFRGRPESGVVVGKRFFKR